MATKNFNFNNLDKFFKDSFSNISTYFKSLNQTEQIGWGLIGLGVVFIILGFVFL